MSKNRNRFKQWIPVLLVIFSLDPVASSSRIRRAPGDTVDNFQALARISSGISLEIGLMDNTITPENAVAELLHYGLSVKTNDIIGLDKTAIDDAINSLETLGKTLKSDKAVTDLEERLLFLQEIGSSFDTDSFLTFAGKQEYVKLLPTIADLGNEKASVKFAKSPVETVLSYFGAFSDWSTAPNAAQADSMHYDIKGASIKLGLVENSVKQLGQLFDKLDGGQGFVGKSSFIEQLSTEDKVRKKLKDSVAFDEIDTVKNNIDEMFKARSSSLNSQKALDIIHKLIQSQSESDASTLKYTSGLPNGAKDLEKLKQDSGNKWIQSRVGNGSLVRDSLEKVFSSFKDLIVKVGRVEASWKDLKDAQKLLIAEKVINGLLSVSNLPDNHQKVSQAIGRIEKCSVSYPNAGSIAKVEPTLGKIRDLNTKVGELLMFRSKLKYTDNLKDMSVLKNILNEAEKMNGEKLMIVNTIVDKLTKDPKFQPLFDFLKQFKGHLGELETLLTDVPVLVGDITTGMKTLEDYHSKVIDKSYMNYFKCLKDLGEDGIAMKTAVETKKKLALDGDFSSVRTIVKTIHDSNDDLKNAVASADEFKNVNDPASMILKDSFTGKVKALEMSEKLGKAVQGLMAIQSAYLSKNNLKTLLNDIPEIIQKSSTSSSLTKEHRDSLSHLSSLKKTFTQIEAFQKTLNDAKSLRKKRATDFKGFDNVFVSADQIPGFTEDIEHIQKALIALDPNKPYSTEMDALKKLDLDFQKFGILAGKDSLPVMDDFFLEYTKKMSEVKTVVNPNPAPNPSGQVAPGQQQPQQKVYPVLEESSEATTLSFYQSHKGEWWFWLLVIGVPVIIIIAIVCLVIYLCRKPEPKPEPPEPPQPDDKPPIPPTPVPTPDPVIVKVEVPVVPDSIKEGLKKAQEDAEEAREGMEKAKEEEAKAKEDANKAQKEAKKAKKEVKETKKNAEAVQKKIIDEAQNVINNVQDKAFKARDEAERVKDELEIVEQKLKEQEGPKGQAPEYVIFSFSKSFAEQLIHQAENNHTAQEWGIVILSLQTEENAFVKKDLVAYSDRKRFYKIICRNEYRHKFKIPGIVIYHCNFIMYKSKKVYMAQGPLFGDEVSDQGHKLTKTVTHFIVLLFEADVSIVIQLEGWTKKNQKKCAQYFEKNEGEFLEAGRFFVATKSVQTGGQGKLSQFTKDQDKYTLYTLNITDTCTNVTKEIDVLSYSGWPEGGAPVDPQPCLEMIRFADDEYKNNIVIQSCGGFGRAGTMGAVMYGIDTLYTKQTPTDVIELLTEVRKHRYGAIQTPCQLTYAALCITKGLMEKLKMSYYDQCVTIDYFHRQIATGKYSGPLQDETEEAYLARKSKMLMENLSEMREEDREKHKEWLKEECKKREEEKGDDTTVKSAVMVVMDMSDGPKGASKQSGKSGKSKKGTKKEKEKSKKKSKSKDKKK